MGRIFSIEDHVHISIIQKEVDQWKRTRLSLNLKKKEEAYRILPSYLLAAYVKNLLEYWKLGEDETHVAPSITVRIRSLTDRVRDILGTIESVIMDQEFDDLECRAVIIRLYHEAGYQTEEQTRLEL